MENHLDNTHGPVINDPPNNLPLTAIPGTAATPQSDQQNANYSTVASFPVGAFPAPLQQFVHEASESLGCPPDFIAVPMLAVLGTAIGNSRALEVKKNWNEGPRIYCAVVARSGTAKSPALDLAMKPMAKRQEALMSELERQRRRDQVLGDLNNKDVDGPRSEIDAEDDAISQIFTTDATVEAIAALLGENPRGIALIKDEITGWVKGMNQYRDGAGSDRQAFLSFWSGSPIVVNRKGTPKEKPKPIRVPVRQRSWRHTARHAGRTFR